MKTIYEVHAYQEHYESHQNRAQALKLARYLNALDYRIQASVKEISVSDEIFEKTFKIEKEKS